MKNFKNKIKNMKGITLIALVITIIVLLILAGVTIATLTGENGLLNKAQTAKNETEKKTATEAINFKITNVQMSKYAEEQRMPTLKELADNFCEDNDFEKVVEKTEVGSLTKISNENPTAIIVKLKAYPYEFEINSSLQLANIDGVKVGTVPANDDDTIVSMTKLELQSLINTSIDNKLSTNLNSTYSETLIWEGTGKLNDTITYNNGYTINDFDSIKFLYGVPRDNNKWDALITSEYSKNDLNFAINHPSSNVYILGLYGYDTSNLAFYNISQTGFTIGEQSTYMLARIYGIKY